MNAALAGLLGTIAGGFIGSAATFINRYFDEKKARRDLMVKTAWDQWSTGFEWIKSRGGQLPPLEVYFFHTLKVVELAARKNLSNEQIIAEVRKTRELTNAIIAEIENENAAKAEEKRRKEEEENWKEMMANMPAHGAPIPNPPETKEK
jgi:hypothetical protein